MMWAGIAWATICGVGLGYYLSLYRKARGDLTFLRVHDINSVRKLYATMRARFYLGLGCVQLIYTTIGILYALDRKLWTPDNYAAGFGLTLLIRALFFGTAIIMAVLAIYTDSLRDKLVDTLDVEEHKEPRE